jgi:hypothetical protein
MKTSFEGEFYNDRTNKLGRMNKLTALDSGDFFMPKTTWICGIPREINRHRRRFLGTAAMTIAAAHLGAIGSAKAQSSQPKPVMLPTLKPGTNTSFGSLKQIDAGVLKVGYAEAGPAHGQPVILLHGWPYDIHSFVDVAPLLALAGYRVIVPYLRGYGTTHFLSSETFRNGQPSAIALDIIALMDALQIKQAILAGFDWGARTANIIAPLWPERVQGTRLGERLSDRQSGIGQGTVVTQG